MEIFGFVVYIGFIVCSSVFMIYHITYVFWNTLNCNHYYWLDVIIFGVNCILVWYLFSSLISVEILIKG